MSIRTHLAGMLSWLVVLVVIPMGIDHTAFDLAKPTVAEGDEEVDDRLEALEIQVAWMMLLFTPDAQKHALWDFLEVRQLEARVLTDGELVELLLDPAVYGSGTGWQEP